MGLPNFAIGIGSGGIEVAQANGSDPVGNLEILQDLLHHQLALAVGVDGTLRMTFGNGNPLWHPISGTGAGEHQVRDPVIPHGLQQTQGSGHIVAVVFAGILDRLAHIGIGGKVDHPFWAIVLDDLIKPLPVGKIPNLQRPPANCPGVPVNQVVVSDGQMARGRQSFAGVAADVARPAGNQETHRQTSDGRSHPG
jgi:hypothetical protein